MGKLILVRHGQTDMNKDQIYYGKLDVPINETGKKQAEKARENLVNLKIDYDKIYSSNQKRAYKTAQIVNYKNFKIEVNEKIQEMNFGIFEGLCYEEIDRINKEKLRRKRTDRKSVV